MGQNTAFEHRSLGWQMNTCRNLETTQKAVAEKERELQGVLPAAQEQQAAIDALTGKLGSIQE